MLFIPFLLSIPCCLKEKNPVEPGDVALDKEGYEQTVRVGHVAVLRDSSGGYLDGKKIVHFEWRQDIENNPIEVYTYQGDYEAEMLLNCVKKGDYRFWTTARTSRTGVDTLLNYYTVHVLERLDSIIIDPALEVEIRKDLDSYTAPLTADLLSTLDTLDATVLCKINNLAGLRYCSNLSWIALGIQEISDISELYYLKNLRVLKMDQQRVPCADISPLAGSYALEYLDINSNGVEDLTPLTNLTNLQHLNVMYNPINNLSPLQKLINLTELKVGNTHVPDINPLKDMTKLEVLRLGACGIEDIAPLAGMTELHLLYLSFKNNISDISCLINCKKLVRLYLDENNIEDISVLEFLPELHYIRLWGNKITDLGPIVRNQNIGNRDIVAVTGNPLSQISINEYIPALRERGVIIEWP